MKTLKKLVKNPASLAGLLIIASLAAVAVLAPVLAPPREGRNPYLIPRAGYSEIPKPPREGHAFGTTQGQYDIYYGIIWGTRSAFKVGLIVTGSIAVLGVLIGTVASYYGGLVDETVMRIVDIFMAFPFLVAAMTLTSILGKGLDRVMLALIAFGWMKYARVMRSEVLTVKEKMYIEASRAIGVGDLRIMLRHVLPNAIFPVFVVATMDIGSMVLWASALSFLGLGAEVGYADWGQLISFSRNWMIGSPGNPFMYWYTVVYPGAAIFLFVLGWNLIGDAFRDILDPRQQGSH